MKIRALIVEDEPLARQHLRDLLAEIDWLECIGEAETGDDAVTAITDLKPDLVFLDVHLPRLNGLEVLERLDRLPAVIFTTAHDNYAIQAFEWEALDYLLKPFGRERLEAALGRARRALERPRDPDTLERARRALDPKAELTRLLVRRGPSIVPIRVKDIERLDAAGDYVSVHALGQRSLVYMTLNEFERRLDPDQFVRIHRGHIVNLDCVSRVSSHGDGRLEVQMRDGSTIVASRVGSRALRRLAF